MPTVVHDLLDRVCALTAEVAVLAERVMGYRVVAGGAGGRVMCVSSDIGVGIHRPFAFAPMEDDRDFCALLDKCAERGWKPRIERDGDTWDAGLYVHIDGRERPRGASDPSRRRALALAAAEAVQAEGERT